MSNNPSRREFLKAGLMLPAAGLISTTGIKAAFGEPSKVVYRTLGKTGLKVSGVGYGIGFVPVTDVVARALDIGINYFDTARDYGDSEKIFSSVIKGRDRSKIVIQGIHKIWKIQRSCFHIHNGNKEIRNIDNSLQCAMDSLEQLR